MIDKIGMAIEKARLFGPMRQNTKLLLDISASTNSKKNS